MSMSLFPMFLKLTGRRCLVVGGGNIATPKIQSLLDSGADVTVVAPQASPQVSEWAHQGLIIWGKRTFQESDLNGAFLVIAGTPDGELNGEVFRAAQQRNILCNAVDDPEHCDFFYPALVRRGDFQVAISTAGHSPALAQRLRKQFESQFGAEYEAWVEDLGKTRKQLFARKMDPEARRQLLHRLASQQAFEAARSAAHAPKIAAEGLTAIAKGARE